MTELRVVSREDLSRVIERAYLDIPPDATIADIMLRECPAYTQEAAAKAYLTLVMDGVKIPVGLWPKCRIGSARQITVIIEAGGITATAVMAIISIVMAVASAIYSIISMTYPTDSANLAPSTRLRPSLHTECRIEVVAYLPIPLRNGYAYDTPGRV